jgi:hypothetical protein
MMGVGTIAVQMRSRFVVNARVGRTEASTVNGLTRQPIGVGRQGYTNNGITEATAQCHALPGFGGELCA